MRVLFILISSQCGLFWYDLCTLTDAGNGFYSKSTALLLWWKVNEIYSERTVIVYSGLRSCRPVWLLSPGFRFSCRCRYLQMNPLDRWVRLNGPFWPFVREPSEPRIRLRARTELTRMLTRSEGCTTPITFRKGPSSPTPRTGYCASPARNQRNGPGAFTWGSVVERWRWRGSGSLCPSHNNNPGRTASSHCEHEDGLEAVIPLVGARGNSHFTPDDGRKRFGAETLLGAHKRIHTDTLSLSQNKMPTGSTAAGMTPSIGAEPTSSDPPTSAACSPPLPSFFHPPLPIRSSIILHSVFFSRPLFSPYSRFCFLVFAKCVKTWRLIRKMHFFFIEARHYSKPIVFERTSQVCDVCFHNNQTSGKKTSKYTFKCITFDFFCVCICRLQYNKGLFQKKNIMHWARHLHFSTHTYRILFNIWIGSYIILLIYITFYYIL